MAKTSEQITGWYRTCQECGFKQPDKEPKGNLTDAYRNKKCKKCKSPALDYGTYPSMEEWEEDENDRNNSKS